MAEMLPFGMNLLATSVPVALPMMFTMTAALGARGLADRGVLVTRLAAIEDAAAMDVLCIDRTGTLTGNRLAVGEIVPLEPGTSNEVLRLAAATGTRLRSASRGRCATPYAFMICVRGPSDRRAYSFGG